MMGTTAQTDEHPVTVRRSFASWFLRLVGLGLLVSVVGAGLGYFPVLRLRGEPGVVALLAACGVSWVAGVIGAAPMAGALSRSGAGSGPAMLNAILAATAIRLFVALALTLSLALSGWFDQSAFVVCVAAAYLWTLFFETLFAVRVVHRTQGQSEL